jgi:lysine 2,3-aminomutase
MKIRVNGAEQELRNLRADGQGFEDVAVRNPSAERFTLLSARAALFCRKYFPEASQGEWNDWRWQLRNRAKSLADLARLLHLSDDERSAIERHHGPLPAGITPYYASLLDPLNPQQPLRRTMVMATDEYLVAPGESKDPLNEDGNSPIPGLVHRYPDRVLFLVTGACAVYCRYCTRSRMVGNPGGEYRFDLARWERAIEYIAATPTVRDVLISGGDPLTLSDDKLEWLLSRLHRIPHVEFLRIGTKVPASLPQRITSDLVRMLRRYHPLWMSIHFTHPDELTPEVGLACARLADAGIPLGSQTVLLAGINDDAETLKRLFRGLLTFRVRPYYLYQCDPVSGSAHFRVPIERGLSLIRSLRGHITGYAVPTYVIDAPGGGGKIPLFPDPILGRDGDDLLVMNFEGRTYRYPDEMPRDSQDSGGPE